MSQMGRLSANPFGTFRENYLQRTLHSPKPNSVERTTTPVIATEGLFRDSDSDLDSPPSSVPSGEGRSLRSSRAFSSSTHHTCRSMNNSYVAPSSSPTPNFDSQLTLNPYASTGQSLNPYLSSQSYTNPFTDNQSDNHIFIDPEVQQPKVQEIDRQSSWIEEPEISHLLAYLERNSTPILDAQRSSDGEHQSWNRLSNGSSALTDSTPREVCIFRFQRGPFLTHRL